jgi:dihydrodipicolinate synthase/N-acetylneuraminate lyase
MPLDWLRGVFPPVPTAFAADGSLSAPLPEYYAHLQKAGVDGIVALGSNGEAQHCSDAERLDWLRAVRKVLPRGLRLIAGAGGQSTRHTIELSRAAADAGAEAVLCITPHYFRREFSRDSIRAHYAMVADHSPVPVIVYNLPSHTGFDLPPDWLSGLAEDHVNLVGIKESSGDLGRVPVLRRHMGEGFRILTGRGEQLAETMEAGADGTIAALANLAPAACAQVYGAAHRKDWDQARSLERRIVPLGEALTSRYGIRGVKAGLALEGFDHGPPRAPLAPLDEGAVHEMRQLLDAADLLPGPVRR